TARKTKTIAVCRSGHTLGVASNRPRLQEGVGRPVVVRPASSHLPLAAVQQVHRPLPRTSFTYSLSLLRAQCGRILVAVSDRGPRWLAPSKGAVWLHAPRRGHLEYACINFP